jgi:uncharacterized protein (DUF983 family)
MNNNNLFGIVSILLVIAFFVFALLDEVGTMSPNWAYFIGVAPVIVLTCIVIIWKTIKK